MLKIGITGGIGSGKTTVCKVFEILGIPVYYSDAESRKLLDEDPEIRSYIRKEFGDGVLNAAGKTDRKKIAATVFGDKEALARLNAVIHPVVGKHFENWASHQNSPYILKEAAILFESGAWKRVDQVIAVIAPQELKIARAMKRDAISREEVIQRMNHQLSDEEKVQRSAFTIINDEQRLLIPQVLKIHGLLTADK